MSNMLLFIVSFSTILTKLFCPDDVFLDVALVNRGSDSVESRHEVIHADGRANELSRWNLHKAHFLTFRIGGERWCEATLGRTLEPTGCLASPDRHHKCLIDHNSEIRTRVAFRLITKSNPVLFLHRILGLASFVLQDAGTSRSIRKADVNSLLETSSHGLI